MTHHKLHRPRPIYLLALGSLLLLILFIFGTTLVWEVAASSANLKASAQISPLHPSFPLLDKEGVNVLDSGEPVSTMQTCGACHDSEFIAAHSFHVDVGLSSIINEEEFFEARPWDSSPGWFGRWDLVAYRYLSNEDESPLDLGTAEWIQTLGLRHVGGGPAEISRTGIPLLELDYPSPGPETTRLDPTSGEILPWDWDQSGIVEMNCFLCHIPSPNNEARIEALESGNFGWANTATLLGSGIVEASADGFTWNEDAFTPEGLLREESIPIQDPSNENCGLCHGLVHDELEEPLALSGCVPDRYRTVTTGQIISPQRMRDSGMNLADKNSLSRSWDIHAERLVNCSDCHYSLNNPVYYRESTSTRPEHLQFDPRRLEMGEYLYQPLHEFARGVSAHSDLAPELKDTMRRCDSCHNVEATHDWLPYKDRHMQELSCETCHIPKIYANAMQQNDWTVLSLDGGPNRACRGVEGDIDSTGALVTGYEPVMLNREDVDGETQIAPFNLITSWYWVQGDPPRPVRYQDLQAVWFDDGQYPPEIMEMFDVNGDGALSDQELRIDSPEKESLIAARFSSIGLENPHIYSDVQPFSINHTVATDEWAIRDCQACHSDAGRLDQSFQLASYVPGEILPGYVQVGGTILEGELEVKEDGALYYLPTPAETELYVFGRDNVDWIDKLGGFLFLATLIGIAGHATLRIVASIRSKPEEPDVQSVYMYSVYERLWHWLQTAVIVLLLFTGLIIHDPDTFGIFSFNGVVIVHNVLAVILLVNAGFSLFYHLASGEIRQYLPRPRGFFDRAIVQVKYYLGGIFKGGEHPFEKSPEKKLNPLQQVTYFIILNVLLPLQVITGILIWGAQRWHLIAQTAGGLPILAPFHTLISWLFASFILLHVYLTTTGPTPTTSIKAMIMGWDDVEVHSSSGKEVTS